MDSGFTPTGDKELRRSEAQKQILTQLLNLFTVQNGLKEAVSQIAKQYRIPYDGLWEWTLERQKDFVPTVEAAAINANIIEVRITDAKDLLEIQTAFKEAATNPEVQVINIDNLPNDFVVTVEDKSVENKPVKKRSRPKPKVKTEVSTEKEEPVVAKPVVIRRANNKEKDFKTKIFPPSLKDYEYKDRILTGTDIYSKIDDVSMITSAQVLKELFLETDDHAVKREIIKVCRNDEIYQLAFEENVDSLKIATIRAIHRQLKSKWDLEGDKPVEKEKESEVPAPLVKKKPSRKKPAPKVVEPITVSVEEPIAPITASADEIIEQSIEATETTAVVETIPEAHIEVQEEITEPLIILPEVTVIDIERIQNIFDIETLKQIAQTSPHLSSEIEKQIANVEQNQETIKWLESM